MDPQETLKPQRVYVLPATQAPCALVFVRRNGWWILLRWSFDTGTLTQGASFKGKLYPRRCDLSPNGELFSYFALKGGGGAWLGQDRVKTYQAISRAPWLFALAAWAEAGTYTRGQHFIGKAGAPPLAPAPHGDATPLTKLGLGLLRTSVASYAIERRRGWVEAADCPTRGANDMWDERRAVALEKARPVGVETLRLEDDGVVDSAIGFDNRRPRYRWLRGKESLQIDDADWCDWDGAGRLLVACETSLRVLDGATRKVLWERELASLVARPLRAPEWAQTYGARRS
jgi:hypothetical protein